MVCCTCKDGWAPHVDGLDVGGGGHVVHHGVEHGLHALVLEGGAAEHWEEFHCEGALADKLFEGSRVRLLALQVLLNPLIILLHRSLDEEVAVLLEAPYSKSVWCGSDATTGHAMVTCTVHMGWTTVACATADFHKST